MLGCVSWLIGTPLQVWLRAAFDVLEDARGELTDEEYAGFVWVLCDRVGLEAARLAVGEALRVAREAA